MIPARTDLAEIVCTVTPSRAGLVIRWYRPAADRPMASAHRRGAFFYKDAGHNGHIPDDVRNQAELAHKVLRRDRFGGQLEAWGTGRHAAATAASPNPGGAA